MYGDIGRICVSALDVNLRLRVLIKVTRCLRFGFAVRCEAVAVPRRQHPDHYRAMPLVRALPSASYWAKGRTRGIARKCKRHIYGGAQPPPHIGRQSRIRTDRGLLGQSAETE